MNIEIVVHITYHKLHHTHASHTFVADLPSLRARNAISHAARGLMTSHRPSEASNTNLSVVTK